jgi:hypothetical protein
MSIIKKWEDRQKDAQDSFNGMPPHRDGAMLGEILELREALKSEKRKTLELQRVYDERGLQIARLETLMPKN